MLDPQPTAAQDLHPKLGLPMQDYEALKQMIIEENNFVTQEQLEEQKLYMELLLKGNVKEKKAITCEHKDKQHYSLGLCQSCYLASYYQKRKSKGDAKKPKESSDNVSSQKTKATNKRTSLEKDSIESDIKYQPNHKRQCMGDGSQQL